MRNLKKIPINKILIGRSVVRVEGIEKNINELANSILASKLTEWLRSRYSDLTTAS